MARLVIREGQQAGRQYVFPPRAVSAMLGRSAASDLQVLDSQSSRRHAEITIEGTRFTLRDLGSSNGTKLDGRKIEGTAEIRYGSRIQIGATEIELVDDSAEGAPPEVPGHRIIERIGAGGMGMVYKAQQLSMDRIVALKILNEKYSTDSAFIGRFVREARAAGRLGHANVIHVNDVGQVGDIHYFSMEYVDGTTVKSMLKEHGRLDVDKALDVVLQTARALKYAHDNGIVHRDVKPDNIMINKEGIVKIADLGIAKTFEDTSSHGEKRIFGTPHYMAPEQALGKDIDARADIYSLGATFYHMLTGATPFSGRTVLEVLKAHIEGHLPPVKDKAPEVPDSVVFIIERMMARQRENRYPATIDLIGDLERVRHDREAEVERVGEGESSIMSSIKRAVSGRKRAETGEERERRKLPVWAGPLIGAGVVVGLVGLFLLTVFVARAIGGGETPEEMLARARELLDSPTEDGRDEARNEAREVLEELVDTYADSPEARLARAILEELDGGRRPAAPTDEGPLREEGPAEALKRAEKFKVDGDLEGALAAIREGMETFADDAGFMENAKAFERTIKEETREKNERAAREALAAVDRYAEQNPEDLEGRVKRLRAAAETFSGTQAGKEAGIRAERLERRAAAERVAEAKRDYGIARDAASRARARGDYDAAGSALQGFLVKHPGSEEATRARAQSDELAREVKSAFDKALAESKRSLDAGRYKLARASLERFQRGYTSEKWNSNARDEVGGLDKVVAEAFREEHDKVKESLAAFNYGEAAVRYRLLASRFGGTHWAKVVERRLKEIEVEQALLSELVRRINASGASSPRELPFPAPKVPAGMAKQKWRVLKASKREVTLGAGGAGRAVEDATVRYARWEDFPPGHLIDLFELFFPEPTTEEHFALAYLCKERGLDARAQGHLAAAAGN